MRLSGVTSPGLGFKRSQRLAQVATGYPETQQSKGVVATRLERNAVAWRNHPLNYFMYTARSRQAGYQRPVVTVAENSQTQVNHEIVGRKPPLCRDARDDVLCVSAAPRQGLCSALGVGSGRAVLLSCAG